MDKKTIKINDVEITEVSSLYDNPFPALALCWYDNGKKGLFYDNVPVCITRHPCDLFKENGEKEVWEPLKRYGREKIEILLPGDAPYLYEHIFGNFLEVSSFGRIGIPIKNESCKGCNGCDLSGKCNKFHYIIPQREKCSWNEGYWNKKNNTYISKQEFEMYNGWLVVDINGQEEFVYSLVAEAFKMKEDIFQKMKEGNKDFIDYIKEICGYGDEENLKKAFKELKNADELQIHHRDNNGHRNTPTYWDENGTMIKGNLIALPEKVHQKIHGKS